MTTLEPLIPKDTKDEELRKRSRQGVWILGVLGIFISISFGLVLPSLEFFITESPNADPPGVLFKNGNLNNSNLHSLVPSKRVQLNESTLMYGFIVGIYGVGEFVGSIVFGHLSNKYPIRRLLLMLLPLAIIGCGNFIAFSIQTTTSQSKKSPQFLCSEWCNDVDQSYHGWTLFRCTICTH